MTQEYFWDFLILGLLVFEMHYCFCFVLSWICQCVLSLNLRKSANYLHLPFCFIFQLHRHKLLMDSPLYKYHLLSLSANWVRVKFAFVETSFRSVHIIYKWYLRFLAQQIYQLINLFSVFLPLTVCYC